MRHADWLMEILTRPVTAEDYYLTPDLDPPHRNPAELADHLLWLLAAPGARLEGHDDLAVAGAIHWIFDPANAAMFRCIGEAGVADETRLGVVAGLERLYSEVVAPRCSAALGHLSEGGPLETAAYMLFDLLHVDPPVDPREAAALHDALIDVMDRILALPHATCQEAALHGLGHWQRHRPERCRAIIDGWLAAATPARPELVPYARAARSGCVL